MGSMQKIGELNTDASGVVLMAGAAGTSNTGTLIIHVKSITGDWTAGAQWTATPTAAVNISTAANITGTGIIVGTAQTNFNTMGQGIPKPSQIILIENSDGAIVADVYWLSGE